jgi:hypothetical protein
LISNSGRDTSLQHPQIIHLVRRHIVRIHHLRTAKKISLKIHKALIPRPHKLRMRLDLLRQHPAMPPT